MKNIFRFVCVAVIVLLSTNLNAQTYRIEAGYLQPVRYSSEMSNRYFNGARLGGTVDFNLPVRSMTLHTGLLYSFTFSNDIQKYNSSSDSTIFKTQGHALDIPLHVTYSVKPFKDAKLFVFGGPNLSIGLYQPQNVISHVKNEGTLNLLNELGIVPGETDLYKNDLRRFNLQLEAGVGFQWRKYMLKGGYSFGINDLSKKALDVQRQSGWHVTAAYEF